MPVISQSFGPTRKRRRPSVPGALPTRVACVALVAPSALVIVFAPPSPTWPGRAASIMQLVTSV